MLCLISLLQKHFRLLGYHRQQQVDTENRIQENKAYCEQQIVFVWFFARTLMNRLHFIFSALCVCVTAPPTGWFYVL